MLVGVAVIALIGGVGLVLSRSADRVAEQRLDDLTGKGQGQGRPRRPAPDAPGGDRPGQVARLGEQADQRRGPQPALRAGRRQPAVQTLHGDRRRPGGRSALVGLALRKSRSRSVPVVGLLWASMPFLWLVQRKKKRIKMFLDAMPEAVELISRALRRARPGVGPAARRRGDEGRRSPTSSAGSSRSRTWASRSSCRLRSLADRIPVMDVRFFVIAVDHPAARPAATSPRCSTRSAG